MPSCLIQTFVLVLDVSIAKFAVLACAVGCLSVTTSLRALHLWQINTFCCHICNGCVGIGAPLAQPGSSRRRRRGTSCPNEAVAAQATQSRAGSPHRDGMTERPLQAGAVVILLLLPFDHPSDLFTSSRYPLSGALWIIHKSSATFSHESAVSVWLSLL